NSSRNDHKSYKLEAVWGTDFLGGRAHTEFAADYLMSPDAMYNWNRPWYDRTNRALYSCAVVNGGPATSLCHTPSAVYGNVFTNAGLIGASAAGTSVQTPPAGQGTSAALLLANAKITAIRQAGPQYAAFGSGANAASNALRGIQFVGPN